MAPARCSLRVALIGSLAMAGCDRCTDEPPPAPPPPKELGDLGMVTPPAEDAASEHFARLAEGLTITALPDDPKVGYRGELRYVTPPCPLRYQVRGEYYSEVAVGREPHGVVTTAEVVATPSSDGDGWRFEVEHMTGAVHVDGERGTKDVDVERWPPAVMRTERLALREIDGPSTLWAAHTFFPALTSVFFPLPQSAEPGTAVGWKQRIYDRGQTAEAEKHRSEGKPFLPKAPEEELANLRLERWIAIDGQPAAVLEGSWNVKGREIEPVESRKAERWRAHAVFLGSGWPLSFVSVANVWRFVAPAEGEGRHTMGTQLRALRLVEACEGPVVPRFDGRP